MVRIRQIVLVVIGSCVIIFIGNLVWVVKIAVVGSVIVVVIILVVVVVWVDIVVAAAVVLVDIGFRRIGSSCRTRRSGRSGDG